MSYRRPNTGDPELDKKLIAEDWENILPQLTDAIAQDIGGDRPDMRFVVWTEKLLLIDRDRTVAWLRGHWSELNHVRRGFVKAILFSLMEDMPS